MPEEIAALDQRISQLKKYVVVLALLWAGTTGVCLMTMSPYAARAAHRSPRPSKFHWGEWNRCWDGTAIGASILTYSVFTKSGARNIRRTSKNGSRCRGLSQFGAGSKVRHA
jgi:hypothetical protein